MAEREGFEPPELSLNGFQDRRLKPLGHLSVSISDCGCLLTIRILHGACPRMNLSGEIRNYGFPFLRTILSAPPMYGLSTSGMITVPSGC